MLKQSFEDFSNRIRTKFNLKENDNWVIEQIYMTLNNHSGGFLLKLNEEIVLGLKVKYLEDGIFKTFYKDPLTPKIQSINTNSRKLVTQDNRDIKIQWFGIFNELRKSNENPSFTLLDKYHYELILPQKFEEMVILDKHLVGDYCAYFASGSVMNLDKS